MLGIEIGNEFLDMPPGSKLELELENPFLQFDAAEVLGGYSFPFEVMDTPKNRRLLRYAGIIQTVIDNTGIDAKIYDGGIQLHTGKIKIEKPLHNLNSKTGTISCYILTGSADFYQDIKERKLRDIDVGGDRSFAWDAEATAGPGFWGHITTVASAPPGDYDYAFFPVINKQWPGQDVTIELMNPVYYDGGIVKFLSGYVDGLEKDLARIVPFPYLHYILTKCFADAGWIVRGDIMDDDDFKKITLINFRAIDIGYIKRLGFLDVPIFNNPVVFNLQDHLPDITVAEFLVAIKNRFGLWYDFDTKSKIVIIKKLNDVVDNSPDDLTAYVNPSILKSVEQQNVVYALRNQFSTDLANGAPDFENISLQGHVDEVADLPAPTEAQNAHVYLVVSENNFYACFQNSDTELWEWQFYTYNIYDYAPENANKEINTAATTIGVEYYSAYLDLIPRIDNQGSWFGRDDSSNWGIHLCYFHGLRDNKSGDPYPYGSSHIYDSTFSQVSQWALSFECKNAAGDDVGLYATFWKRILDILNSPEELEAVLYLPLHKYLKLSFSQRIIIDGVMMFIRQINKSIPYNKSVSIKGKRII